THMASDALVQALKNGSVDLAIIESYPYVSGEPVWTPVLAKHRLMSAKKAGVMEKCIPAFWISPGDETFSKEFFEEWFQLFRKDFPQMPGVAPLFPGGHNPADSRTLELTRLCNELIQKYYIAPAPKVRI